jgi:hypothetical protein
MMDAETARFIKVLVDRVRTEHTFDVVMKEWKQNKALYKGRWDTPVRRIFGPVIREVFQQTFPNVDDKKFLYVEGEGTLTLKHTKLFGSAVYPDAAVLRPRKIAIELDHSEKGSGLKMALAKAAFNTLSEDWEYCFVLFYNQNGKLSIEGEKERRICKIYEEQFNTQIFLFE